MASTHSGGAEGDRYERGADTASLLLYLYFHHLSPNASPASVPPFGRVMNILTSHLYNSIKAAPHSPTRVSADESPCAREPPLAGKARRRGLLEVKPRLQLTAPPSLLLMNEDQIKRGPAAAAFFSVFFKGDKI